MGPFQDGRVSHPADGQNPVLPLPLRMVRAKR